MGYGYYEINTPEGKPMKRGYGVRCKCHQRGCTKQIDRGLAYLCYSCTWYFCEREHLTRAWDENDDPIEFDCFAGVSSQCCIKCSKEAKKSELYPCIGEDAEPVLYGR